ncbi:hypothetical protein, partial [Hymenobacter coccineus]|uniref:hypothetical protein n=1 Tax=Hymenobacter coccineus TaxID=1908235 RepID=UPI001955CDA2
APGRSLGAPPGAGALLVAGQGQLHAAVAEGVQGLLQIGIVGASSPFKIHHNRCPAPGRSLGAPPGAGALLVAGQGQLHAAVAEGVQG